MSKPTKLKKSSSPNRLSTEEQSLPGAAVNDAVFKEEAIAEAQITDSSGHPGPIGSDVHAFKKPTGSMVVTPGAEPIGELVAKGGRTDSLIEFQPAVLL